MIVNFYFINRTSRNADHFNQTIVAHDREHNDLSVHISGVQDGFKLTERYTQNSNLRLDENDIKGALPRETV